MARPLTTGSSGNMVTSMRNGVIAIRATAASSRSTRRRTASWGSRRTPRTRAGTISDLLRGHPDLVRLFAAAFELIHLPNRAELRLKPTGTVIGYTLSLVRDERRRVRGAALFFKDLTLVEQAEERERLRDRLAALGEMAATIAHEVKNPLASIEVMAGLLRRQVGDRDGPAQAMLGDIINEAKMANAIVLEVLDFVRPIRLQVDRTTVQQVVQDAIPVADRKLTRRATALTLDIPCRNLPAIQGDHQQLCQVVTQPAHQRAARRRRAAAPCTSRARTPADAGRADAPARRWSSDRGRRPGHSARRSATGSSIRSSRPSRRDRGSASPSCARSSTRTKAGST